PTSDLRAGRPRRCLPTARAIALGPTSTPPELPCALMIAMRLPDRTPFIH
ncbi:hypothetical protein JKG47_23550, partial [Acidithiobacillus sp. MC6.1]|nr:hypothetical protein [Acidithiobacillus sp. MC6.1]